MTIRSFPLSSLCFLIVSGVAFAESDGPLYTPPASAVSASVPADPSSIRLILELKEGSRVVGKYSDDSIRFHSALLGDLKLALPDVRSIEADSSGNSVKLTAKDGDVLTVQFSDSTLSLETDFGKTEVPVKLIKGIKIAPSGKAAALPAGLAALWSGDGNGVDSANGHDATVSRGMHYAPGIVGMAFNFDGSSDTVTVPASQGLDVGAGPGFTATCWIAPTSTSMPKPLLEWAGDPHGMNDASHYGVHFWLSTSPGNIPSPGCIYANIMDNHGVVHIFATPALVVQAGAFQQVALTYDKASGMGKLYYNGAVVKSENLGSFTPQTSTGLLIGQRSDGGDQWHYQGILDEIALYNRALTPEEIKGVYDAQKLGGNGAGM